MSAAVDVEIHPDGTVVIQPHGVLGSGHAAELQRTVVHTVRHTRPPLLVLDLHDVDELDPLNLGTLVAACQVGDDHNVAVFLDFSSSDLARQLIAAGVPSDRLRHIDSRPL